MFQFFNCSNGNSQRLKDQFFPNNQIKDAFATSFALMSILFASMVKVDKPQGGVEDEYYVRDKSDVNRIFADIWLGAVISTLMSTVASVLLHL